MSRYVGPSLIVEHGSNRASQPIENLPVEAAYRMLVEALDERVEDVWWYVERGER